MKESRRGDEGLGGNGEEVQGEGRQRRHKQDGQLLQQQSQQRTHGRSQRPGVLVATALTMATALTTTGMAPRVAAASAGHRFPYVPTQILMPDSCLDETACDGRDVAYVLTQGPDTLEFLALNITGRLDADTGLKPVTMGLPFVAGGGDTTAVGAVRAGDGRVLVYAGACDGGAGEVWHYTPAEDRWEEVSVVDDDVDKAAPRGPYFLGGTLAFSSTLAPSMSPPTIYTYGGMCAHTKGDAEGWQGAANYTKTMMAMSPASDKQKQEQDGDDGYSIRLASSGGPRTAIAGFTLTPLPPSMSNISGTVTQQASYVLLGGHSQRAFINMSTAAVWNLPAESWTYVDVQAPSPASQKGSGGLLRAAKVDGDTDGGSKPSVDNVYSRSGHTAVLSEDGASVVVLGGWVGDVDTPAEPQLAVLEMSGPYSGWQWRIPEQQPQEAGVYGHGAAVLPGNVMAVYGGWEIQPTDADKTKRQATTALGARFLNLTSMTWSSSYQNPALGTSPSGDTQNGNDANGSGPSNLGLSLGLGLGLGLALITAAVLLFYCWYRRRSKRRESRDMVVRALSQDLGHFRHDTDEMMERDDFASWNRGGWYTGGPDAYQQGDRSLGFESLRGGRNSAYRGVQRKSVQRPLRGSYVPAASHPGHIHPILEDDEEEPPAIHHGEPQTPVSDVHSDPFMTPTAGVAPVLLPPAHRGSATPSPESMRRDPDVQDWVSEVDAADALLARMNSRHGRGSPTRRNSHRSVGTRDDDSRSGSNLSDSARSVADSLRRSPTGRRTTPGATSSLLGGITSGATSSLLGGSTLLGGSESQKPGSSSSSSYNTARSSFGVLQAEGPSLLMGRYTESGAGCDDDDGSGAPGSPSKSKPRRNWLGSLRRVFSTSGSTSPATSRDDSPRRSSLDHDPYSGDYEPRLVGLNGELLRRKQGRQDWETGDAGEARAGQGDTDWDIERAVENRLVQVMFTVPKERLRVVNADENEGPDEEPRTAELVSPVGAKEKPGVIAEEEDDGRRGREPEKQDLLSPLAKTDSGGDGRRLSRSTLDSAAGELLTAQAVTVERPRTRVLQMVDSFETLSREGSPSR